MAIGVPEGLEGVVADGHTGGEIQLLEFVAKLAEAETGAVCDLGAAVQVQHFDVSAVLRKCPGKTVKQQRGRKGITQESLH